MAIDKLRWICSFLFLCFSFVILQQTSERGTNYKLYILAVTIECLTHGAFSLPSRCLVTSNEWLRPNSVHFWFAINLYAPGTVLGATNFCCGCRRIEKCPRKTIRRHKSFGQFIRRCTAARSDSIIGTSDYLPTNIRISRYYDHVHVSTVNS